MAQVADRLIGFADENAACHGTVTVGSLVLMDSTGGGDVLKLEFM